jgi:hypothetical protein
MSLVNVTLRAKGGFNGFVLIDNLTALANNTQTGAASLPGKMSRCTVSTGTTNSFVMDSILSGTSTDDYVWFINDSANSVNVFPAIGENQNGAANAVLAVAAGKAAVFVRIPNDQGGPDWRSAVIT